MWMNVITYISLSLLGLIFAIFIGCILFGMYKEYQDEQQAIARLYKLRKCELVKGPSPSIDSCPLTKNWIWCMLDLAVHKLVTSREVLLFRRSVLSGCVYLNFICRSFFLETHISFSVQQCWRNPSIWLVVIRVSHVQVIYLKKRQHLCLMATFLCPLLGQLHTLYFSYWSLLLHACLLSEFASCFEDLRNHCLSSFMQILNLVVERNA